MLTIALTGGIGSGKTAATDLFHELASRLDFQCSLKIIDADIIARNLLAGSLKESSSAALKKVRSLFGSDLFDSEGYLKRDKLRALIFSDKDKKHQLEVLLHPLVYDEIYCQLSNIQSAKIDIVIIAIPLFFEARAEVRAETIAEAKINLKFDRILVIDVPAEIQIERSIKRDNCSAELIKEIINSQVDRQIRLNHADDIIDNSGTLLELQLKIEALLKYYCSLSEFSDKPPS